MLSAVPGRREIDNDAEIAQMVARLRADDGLLVDFNGIRWRRMTTEEDIEERDWLREILKAPEGGVYKPIEL